LYEIGKDARLFFNLITSGVQCDNVMRIIEEDPKFKSYIKHVCVYFPYIQNRLQLKRKDELVYDVVAYKDFLQKILCFVKQEK